MNDVIVVGAGPAGTIAARALAKKGYDTVVLEEHATPGLPQHCTGLITDETIRLSGVKPDIINTLYGAEVVFPDGRTLRVQSKKPKGRMVDRVDLELRMADAALRDGARFSFNDRYESHSIKDGAVIQSTTGRHKAKLLIGADGQASRIAASLGDNEPEEYVRGMQVDVKMRMDDQDVFRLFIGNKLAPGFFAWQIPCGDFTRIGLCTKWSAGPPATYLTDLLIKLGAADKVDKLYVGKIPLGGRPRTYDDRILLAGDAAGLVKPVSGGGLYPAFKANKHLVEAASSALEADSFFARELSEYERGWKEEIGKSLTFGYSLRKKYLGMSDADLNKAYLLASKPDVRSKLDEIDLDNPGETAKLIIKNPKTLFSGIGLMMRSIR